MISDDKLLGWLVFWRHQSVNEIPNVAIPRSISGEMVARGWITPVPGSDWEGTSWNFTQLGLALSDLTAPEYGIDPCPMEMEA